MKTQGMVIAGVAALSLLYGGVQLVQGQQNIGNPKPAKPFKDSDHDGLPDSLEKILKTDPSNQDTDQDGFSDAEELARKSNPRSPSSTPNPQAHPKDEFSLGLWAEQPGASELIAYSVIYLPAGWQSGLTVELVRVDTTGNLEYSNQLQSIPQFVNTIAGKKSGSQVVTVKHSDFPAPWVSQLQAKGVLSVASVLDDNNQGLGIAADDALFRQWDGSFCQWHEISPNQEMPGGAPSSGIYSPLGGEVPATWESGKICEQKMAVSGVNGPVVLQEVTGANCSDAWASFCGSDCSASVGQTIQMVDPLALIGG